MSTENKILNTLDSFVTGLDNQPPSSKGFYQHASSFFQLMISRGVKVVPLVNIKKKDEVILSKMNNNFDGVKEVIHNIIYDYDVIKNIRKRDYCDKDASRTKIRLQQNGKFWSLNSSCKPQDRFRFGDVGDVDLTEQKYLSKKKKPLFNPGINIADCFEINPLVTTYVRSSYDDTEKLRNVPIYFFVKLAYNDLLSHSSLIIYFKDTLYSLGFALTEEKKASIMLGDFILRDRKKGTFKDGLYVVDIGLLTSFHIDRIKDIISTINSADVEFCLRLCKKGIAIEDLYLTLGLSSSYCKFTPNPTAKYNNSKIAQMFSRHDAPKVYTNTKLPRSLNCTSTLQWIFSQTVLCVGSSSTSSLSNTLSKSVVIPGLCKRIKFIEEKGYPVYDPITEDNLREVFFKIQSNNNTVADFKTALRTVPADTAIQDVPTDEVLVPVPSPEAVQKEEQAPQGEEAAQREEEQQAPQQGDPVLQGEGEQGDPVLQGEAPKGGKKTRKIRNKSRNNKLKSKKKKRKNSKKSNRRRSTRRRN